MHLPRSLILILLLGAACEDLREFRMEADPAIDVVRIGTDQVGRQTPFVYPLPASMRSEPEPESEPQDAEGWAKVFTPRFMEILIRDSANQESLHRFEKVFRYPARRPSLLRRGQTRPQGWMDIVLPGIGTQGRIWIRGSENRLRLCTVNKGMAMVVRLPLTAHQRFFDSGDPQRPMSEAGTRVEQVQPGEFVISMPNWRLEMELPAGLSLFVDEGKGKSNYLHLSYPKALPLRLGAKKGDSESKWIHGKDSLFAPALQEASLWTASLRQYRPDGTTDIVGHLPNGDIFHLQVKLRKASRKLPPLLLALTWSPQ